MKTTIAQARKAQEPKETELQLVDRTFAILCAPIKGADYVNVYGRDITHLKRAEEDLERSLSLLRATLDSTTDGILVVDKEGKVVNCNRKFMEMWRVTKPIGELRCTREEMGFVLSQLRNPELFLSRVTELQATQKRRVTTSWSSRMDESTSATLSPSVWGTRPSGECGVSGM